MNKSFFSFLFGKKALANIWWIIIGAVLALVVLIVILLIFTGKTTPLEQGLLDCESKGGQCLKKDDCLSKKYDGTVSSAFECSEGNVCCFTLFKETDKKDSDNK